MTEPPSAELPTAPITATPLVVIDGCEADQLVGDQTAHLASGTLQLFPGTTPSSPELVDPTGVTADTGVPDSHAHGTAPGKNALTIRIGTAAFSFEPHLTTVFTHAENARWYFFSLSLPSSLPSSTAAATSSPSDSTTAAAAAVGSGSYVRFTLPEGIDVPGSALEKSRDAFEDILIGRGFLSGDAILSGAEEFGRGIAQDASTAASALKVRTSEHISSTDEVPPSQHTSFSPTTHSFVDGAAVSTAKTAGVTGWMAEKFAGVSISVGERVAGLFGIHVSSEDELAAQEESGPRGGVEPAPASTSGLQNRADVPDENDPTSEEVKEIINRNIESSFVLLDSTAASSEFSTSRHTPALVEEGNQSTWEKTKTAATTVGSGVGDGAKELSAAASEAAHAAIQHDYGSEAAKLAGTAGGAVKDAGATVTNVLGATSVPIIGATAVYGAIKTPAEEVDVDRPDTQPSSPEPQLNKAAAENDTAASPQSPTPENTASHK